MKNDNYLLGGPDKKEQSHVPQFYSGPSALETPSIKQANLFDDAETVEEGHTYQEGIWPKEKILKNYWPKSLRLIDLIKWPFEWLAIKFLYSDEQLIALGEKMASEYVDPITAEEREIEERERLQREKEREQKSEQGEHLPWKRS